MADLSYAREASEYVIAADLPDSQKEAALRAYLAAAESGDRRIKEAVMAVLWPGERQGRFVGPIFEWGHETTPTLAEVEEIADEIVAASQPPVALREEERRQ